MFRKIVVGYDEGEHGEEALGLAFALAEVADADVLVARVLNGPVGPPRTDGSPVLPALQR
jgi:hypothetical protein